MGGRVSETVRERWRARGTGNEIETEREADGERTRRIGC